MCVLRHQFSLSLWACLFVYLFVLNQHFHQYYMLGIDTTHVVTINWTRG